MGPCARGLGAAWAGRSTPSCKLVVLHAPALCPLAGLQRAVVSEKRLPKGLTRCPESQATNAPPLPAVAAEKSCLAHCRSGTNTGPQLRTFILCTQRLGLAIFYRMQLAPGCGSDSCDLQHS